MPQSDAREPKKREKILVYLFGSLGDSIVAIHIIARSNEKGFQLSPQLLFNHPTVAMLTTVAGATQDRQDDELTLLTQTAAAADDYRTADFDLAILDERTMNKLSQLFPDRG